MYDEQAREVTPAVMPGTSARNFRLLVLNSSISMAGMSGFSLAVIWIALLITKSTVLAGFADGMGALPLFLSFAFGAYVDSLASKRRLALFVSVARVASIVALYLAIRQGGVVEETAAIYFVAFVIGLTSDIMNSIRASWMKQFLAEDAYKKGSSSLNSAVSLAQAAGFAASGALIVLGTAPAILSFGLIFAVSAVPLFFVGGDSTAEISMDKKLHSSMAKGLKYIFSDTRLRALIIITLVVNLAFGMVAILFASLVDQEFGLPAIYYTMLFLSLTGGIFAGSAAGGKVSGRIGTVAVATLSSIGILLFLIGKFSDIYPDYPVSFAMGVLIGIINVIIMTAIVGIVQQDMMARVMGAVKTFAISLTFMSGAIGGVLIRLLGISRSFYLMGVIIIVSALLPFFFRDFYNTTV